ncbi:class I lanthipeptide [Flavobacterium sp. H4147]|uniref:class I lanthipeptide n=1 Tax=unclassified Flavobacterium TaxID=196869 RepID=UPI0023EAFE7F|nr:class I lanthipeptide [Flavobacterium sp. H4147]
MKDLSLNNKLYFKKADVTELNDNLLAAINGGTSIIGGDETCTGCCCLKVTFDLM